MREAIAGREHSFGEIDPDLRIMPRAGKPESDDRLQNRTPATIVDNAGSSKGRTAGLDPVNLGSTPSPAASSAL